MSMPVVNAFRAWFVRRSQDSAKARQFWRTVPLASRLLLIGAVFCLFSTFGFLTDIGSLGRHTLPEVLANAVVSGLIAVVYAIVATRAPRWMVVVVAIHMALTFLVTRFGSPPAPLPAEVETTWLRRRMQFDMTGTLLGVLAAYVLFVVFIGREGNRYVRVHTEMALARDIHQALVPRLESRIGPYDVVGASHPAGDVGGDLVDVVATNDGWFAYVVDVSGHGVSSGVLMGMTKSAVRMRAASEDRLEALLDELNRTLIPLKKPNMFATFAGLRVGTEATLEYALAGHLPLLHVRPRPAGEPADVTEHHIGQIPLGVTDDYHFRSARIGLEPGDLVVLVTDGLTEVFDRADRELGLDGVKAVLAREARAPLGRVVEELQRAAGAHGPQLDDQTVLLLRYAPGPGPRERTRPV